VKKALKIIVIVLFVAFIGIQFIRPDMTNPPVAAEKALESVTQVPEPVGKILERSCSDCHSSKTVYPWYAQIAPASWFLADHIKDGRRELNFSEWGNYETRRKRKKLEEVCEQVKTKEMPLPSYLWIHWGAKLSDEEINILCDWSNAEAAKLAATEEAAKQ
jgi:hypothetical protein